MIISFSGLDGAGKTTQIIRLKEYLESRGSRTYVLTMYDEVSFSGTFCKYLKSLKRPGTEGGARHRRLNDLRVPLRQREERFGENASSVIFRRDKNDSSWPLFFLRMGFYVLDTLTLRHRLASAVKRYKAVTCDRFIYDSLVNLLSLRNRCWVREYVRLMLVLAPKPDVAVFLDVPPEKAFARKPEYPLEYMERRSLAYRTLFSMLPAGRTVFARGGVSEMFSTIREVVDGLET